MKRFIIPIFALLFFASGLFLITNTNSLTYVSDTQKNIIRDTKRLNDLTVLKTAIEAYKTKNGYYPKLDTGSNIKGYVNSVWDTEWTSFCSLVGLSSCPVDPVNVMDNCNCSAWGVCTGTNVDSNIDKAACYNSKSESFACTPGSNLYQYQVLNNGRNYSLMMEFEYSDNIDWDITSAIFGNYVFIKDTCLVGSPLTNKILSNKTPKCGDSVLDYNEACEVGSKKTEFCNTASGVLGKRLVSCSSSSCTWDDSNPGICVVGNFCGDGVKDANEECDGGFQKMCYSYQDSSDKKAGDVYVNNSHYNWYNEQIRYCNLSCKWDKKFIDSTAYCGGFCGDGKIQADKGEECDNSTNPHCDSTTCKYINTAPVFNFDFFNNRNSKSSYIKSDVWSGDKLQYQNDYFNTGNIDLVIADKQGSKYVAVWNSDYIEIKVNASNKYSDPLKYKYKITDAYNGNIKLKYFSDSCVKNTDWFNPACWLDYLPNAFVASDAVRIYPTVVSNGSNLKNTKPANSATPYNGDLLFGQNYVGKYSMLVTASDSYKSGAASATNPHEASSTYDFSFYIGSGCGDRILQKDLGEVCEWKPATSVNNIYMNWGTYTSSSTNTDTSQPDGSGACAAYKFNETFQSGSSFNWGGKIDDASCSGVYYGLCERRASFGCDGWIRGGDDNCYIFTTTTKSWSDANLECISKGAYLVNINDSLEEKFINSNVEIKKNNIFWAGYSYDGSKWNSVAGGFWTQVPSEYPIFKDTIYGTGSGTDKLNQYFCNLPWYANSCRPDYGYCGDSVSTGLFEECDKTDKTSYGRGTDLKNQYDCGTTCKDQGGYCGNSSFESSFEHCDPTTRISPSESASNVLGLNNVNHQYVCQSKSVPNERAYFDFNDFESTNSLASNNMCRKSFGGYCGDGDIQMFYTNTNGVYTIDSSMIDTQGGTKWKNLSFDINAKKYKYNGAEMTSTQLNNLIEECDPKNYPCDSGVSSDLCVAPKNSTDVRMYGGCGQINSDLTSSPVVQSCFQYLNGSSVITDCAGSCVFNATTKTCTKQDVNSCTINLKSQNGSYNMVNYSGSCGCKKLQGGYCGDSIVQTQFTEECDSMEKDDNSNQVYQNGKLVESDSSNSINRNSSSLKQYLCGATTKYSEVISDLNKYTLTGTIEKTFSNVNNSDFSCNTFGGYCGDGAVQSSYTVLNQQIPGQSWFYDNLGILEQCDPKGHSVDAKYSSTTNRYSCGSIGTTNSCLDLDYATKDASGNYGGYCGDGYIQYSLTGSGVQNNPANYDTFRTTSGGDPEQCDPRGHNVPLAESNVNSQYICGTTEGNTNNSCANLGGYCGNTTVDVYRNFSTNEPSGDGDCVTLNNGSGWDGRWNDANCLDSYFSVCEFENPSNGVCPSGFVFKNSGGNYNCYKISDLASNFASINCPVGSHVAVVNSRDENSYISSIIGSSYVWIGFNDVDREGEFVWANNNGYAEECDPTSTDYKSGSISRILTGGAVSSNVNKQYICGATSSWTSNVPADKTKYNSSGTAVSSFAFDNTAQGNNSCLTFGGYCGDGVIQYDLYTTKHNNVVADQIFFYGSSNGSLEQCDPNGHSVISRYSSDTNQYSCGSAGVANACTNIGGYCGDGTKQSTYEECDPTAKTGNDYSSSSLVANASSGVTANSSYSKQYKCGKPQVFTTLPGIKKVYSNTGNVLSTFTDPDLSSVNNTSACKTFGGYCGDGVIQITYDSEKQQSGVNPSDQSWFYSNLGTLEECDPNNHSVIAQYSSASNSYTCGSANTTNSCVNLDVTQKDSFNNYGGYCGDGYVEYNLSSIPVKNDPANDSIFQSTANGNPEQCDPNNHVVSAFYSGVNNTYLCGTKGTASACTDLIVSEDSKSGYCGDGKIQYDLSKTSVSQADLAEISSINIDNSHPEECDPSGHVVLAKNSSDNNTYYCGIVSDGSDYACRDVDYSTTNATTKLGGYCGDGALQDGSNGTQDKEECDYIGYVPPVPKDSTASKTYVCGNLTTVYPGDANHDLACRLVDAAHGGGYCGDGSMQYCKNNSGDILTNSSSCWDIDNVKLSNVTSLEQCDPKNNNIFPAGSSLINQYVCGYMGGSDACMDKSGYCGDGKIQMSVNVDGASIRTSTNNYLSTSDNYQIGAPLEKCDPSYIPTISETNRIFANGNKLPDIYTHAAGANDVGFVYGNGTVSVDGDVKVNLSRSWNVVVFDANWDYLDARTFDVYGSVSNATAMNSYLNALSSDKYVLFVTWDEPRLNIGNVWETLKNFGANEDTLSNMIKNNRGSYVMVGKKNIGQDNNFFEGYDTNGGNGVTFTTKNLNDNLLNQSGITLSDTLHYTCKSDCTFTNTVNDFCGDGVVQDGSSGTVNRGEKCDPKNYVSPDPQYSSLSSQYTCSLVCADDGGYCGNGVVDSAYGEECDPLNYSRDAQGSNTNSTYSCGAVGTAKACKKLFWNEYATSPTKYGGYCGDGHVQYNLGLPAGSQNDPETVTWKKDFTVNLTSPENCDPLDYFPPSAAQSSSHYQYSCIGTSVVNACTFSGGYCGDKIINGSEQCDYDNYTQPTPAQSTSAKSYVCGDNAKNIYACAFLDSTNGGGWCNDGVLQSSFGEKCEKTSLNTSLVGWFKLNGDATDSSINSVMSSPVGVSYVEGKYGKAANFDGSTSTINLSGVNVNTAAGAKNTVSFWMNWNGTDSDIDSMPIGFNSYDLDIYHGKFGFNTTASDVYGINFPASTYANKWIHVVATFYNGVPSSVNNELYINGVKQSISYVSGSFSYSSSVSSTFNISGWGANSSWKFRGLIDDVRIYNRQLTSSEVSSIYTTAALADDTYDISTAANRSNLTCTSACGTTADGWTCDSDYYWNAASIACLPVPGNSTKVINTNHGGDNYKCADGFEKDGIGGCKDCVFGKYSNDSTNNICVSCAAISNSNWVSKGTLPNNCQFNCSIGYSYDSSARKCNACANGKANPEGNQNTTCSNCTDTRAANQIYSSNNSSGSCFVSNCVAGTYPKTVNGYMDNCGACASLNGSYAWAKPGEDCTFTCNSNYFLANSTTCQTCGTEKWSPAGNILGNCNDCQYNDWEDLSCNIGAAPSWTQRGVSSSWSKITMSSNGLYQTAIAVSSGYIYTSSDYGNTWIVKMNDALRSWSNVTMSFDGKYQMAITGNYDQYIYTSSDYGSTWAAKDTNILLGVSNNRNFTSISMSMDGKYQALTASGSSGSAGDYVYLSSNYGSTWTKKDVSGNGNWTYRNYIMSSISASGQYQIVVSSDSSYGYIYVSSDYGSTWTRKSAGYYLMSSAISADGRYQTAVSRIGGYIYVSSDYGVNWIAKQSAREYYAVSMSTNGQYQTAVVNNGYIYVSSDYGANWTQKGTSSPWNNIAMSADGKYQISLITSGYNGTSLQSSDYGVNWTNITSGVPYSAAGISDNGVYQTVAKFNGYIYTYNSTGTWSGSRTLKDGFSDPARCTITSSSNAIAGGCEWCMVPIINTSSQACAIASGVGKQTRTCLINMSWGAYGSCVLDYCGAGYYQADASSCQSCPIGKYSVAGSTGVGSCQNCVSALAAGYVYTSAGTNASSCSGSGSKCAAGTMAASVNGYMDSCKVCDPITGTAGTYTWSNPGVSCAWTANAGNYQENLTSVKQCPAGSYCAAGTIAATIQNCPNGKWSSAGSSVVGNCSNCNAPTAGYIYTGKGDSASTCSLAAAVCSAGTAPGTVSGYMDSCKACTGTFPTTGNYKFTSGCTWGCNTNYYYKSANNVCQACSPESWAADANQLSACNPCTYDTVNTTCNNNAGNIWDQRAVSAPWRSVAMSSSSQYQTAVAYGNYIYISSDYGVTWAPKMNDTGRNWISVALSSDGQYQSAVVSGSGYIYVSSDYGVTWAPKMNDTNRSWYSVSVSSSGQYQTAISSNTYIYVSSNYGVTWAPKMNDTGRSWQSVAMSSDGKYQTAVAYGNYIYASSDYGVTWTQKTPSSALWYFIDMSSSGQYQTAVAYSNYIYISSDYGVTWAQKMNDTGRSWYSVSVSSNGQYQTAISNSTYVYVSSDYGVTWTPKIDSSNRNWISVAMSSSGQYQTAVANSNVIFTSYDYGVTWTPKMNDTGRSWQFVAVSSNGQYQTAVANNNYIYTSNSTWNANKFILTGDAAQCTQLTTNNNGACEYCVADGSESQACSIANGTGTQSRSWTCANNAKNYNSWSTCVVDFCNYDYYKVNSTTCSACGYDPVWTNSSCSNIASSWTTTATSRNWASVALSSDGKYQLAGDNSGNLYRSPDYGVTWLNSIYSGVNVYGLAMSSDGKYQSRTSGTFLYVSSDYGVTWKDRAYNSATLRSVSVSSTGQYQSNVASTGTGNGYISTSSDYGVTWAQTGVNNNWISIAISSTGQYQTAVANAGYPYIYISSDYGATWTQKMNDTNRNWYSVSMSSSGQYQTAVVYNGYIYKSADYGETWVNDATLGNLPWMSVSVSGDGKTQVVSSAYISSTTLGSVYYSDNYGATWINSSIGPSTASWKYVAISSDGNFAMTVNSNSDYVYKSSNIASAYRSLITGNSAECTNTVKANNGSCDTCTTSGSDSSNCYVANGIGNLQKVWTCSGGTRNYSSNLCATSTCNVDYYKVGISSCSACGYSTPWTNGSCNDNVGTNWSQIPNVTSGAVYTTATAISYDNKYQTIAVYNSYIKASSDYGVTWTQKSPPSAAWNSVAMSIDGQYQVAVATNNGYIYGSSDYGVTWTQRSSVYSYWTSVSMSSNGQYQTAVANNSSYIYGSSDYGVTWTLRSSVYAYWTSVSMSSNGKYQTAVANSNGYIYGSSDYGVTWIKKNSTSGYWVSVSMSSNGQYQTAVVGNYRGGGSSGYVYVSSDYGNTWMIKINDTYRSWTSVSMSSSGQYQTVSNLSSIYISLDYGVNWTKGIDANSSVNSVYMSSNGKYQLASSDSSALSNVYSSSDYGSTWTVRKAISNGASSAYVSYDGAYQMIGTNYQGAYRSTSTFSGSRNVLTGNTSECTTVSTSDNGSCNYCSSSGNESSVCSINNGYGTKTRSYACVSNNKVYSNWSACAFSSCNPDYYQVDSANCAACVYSPTWTNTSCINNSTSVWNSNFSSSFQQIDNTNSTTSISSDGKYQLIASRGYIYLSIDYGATWTQRGPFYYYYYGNPVLEYFPNSSMSSDGQYQLIGTGAYTSSIYVSSDYGVTWGNPLSNNNMWPDSVAVSSSGKYMAVSEYFYNAGNLYVSSSYGSSWSPASFPNCSGSARYYKAFKNVVMSSDGKYMFAVAGSSSSGADGNSGVYGFDGLYVSSDYGNSWSVKDPGDGIGACRAWNYVAASSTGQYVSAVSLSGYVDVSSDYGATWTKKVSDTTRSWSSVSVSPDGQYQVAAVSGGYLYSSLDYGVTWNVRLNDANRSWKKVASYGQYQFAYTSAADYIYISSDYGVTWNPKASSAAWMSVSTSNDGQYWVATNSIAYKSSGAWAASKNILSGTASECLNVSNTDNGSCAYCTGNGNESRYCDKVPGVGTQSRSWVCTGNGKVYSAWGTCN